MNLPVDTGTIFSSLFTDQNLMRGSRGGVWGSDRPWNFGKNVVIGFVNGTGLILHIINVEYNPD